MTGTTSPTALDLREVTLRRSGRTLLSEFSLTVRPGEHWALLGPNGAGKSTALSLCGALTHPTTGTVDVLGHRLGRVELQALRRRIGHVNPRHPLQSALTITDLVLTGLTGSLEIAPRWRPDPEQLKRAWELIDLFGLTARADERWPTLSQGERGRALIARALVSEPDLLLLDEPCTGLDIAAREQLLFLIDQLPQTHPDLTSVLVTHHLEELPQTTTHALLIHHGRVVASGPIRQALTGDTISTAFEYPIDVHHHQGRWSARTRRSAARA